MLCRVARLRLHALARQKRHIWLRLGGLNFASGIPHPPNGNFATTLKLSPAAGTRNAGSKSGKIHSILENVPVGKCREERCKLDLAEHSERTGVRIRGAAEVGWIIRRGGSRLALGKEVATFSYVSQRNDGAQAQTNASSRAKTLGALT